MFASLLTVLYQVTRVRAKLYSEDYCGALPRVPLSSRRLRFAASTEKYKNQRQGAMRCLLLVAPLAAAVRRGHSHTPFDQDPFVFDPKGRLLQLDYADTAASKGAPCVGLCANNIAVLAAVGDKIADVDARHAMTFAGVRADGYALVDFVRVHAARERLRLPDEAPATRALALALADECHTVCIGGGRRAYGCRCLLAGLDPDGEACLWSIDPGGDARHHKSGVAAVGAGAESVIEALRSFAPTDAEAAVAAAAAAVLDAADDGQVASVVALALDARGQACRRWRADLSPEDLQSDAWRIACREALAPSSGDGLVVY